MSVPCPSSARRRGAYRAIGDRSGRKKRRNLVSNGIEPFACFGQLLRGFGPRCSTLPETSAIAALDPVLAASRRGFVRPRSAASAVLKLCAAAKASTCAFSVPDSSAIFGAAFPISALCTLSGSMTVLAGRSKWDHASHATPNRQAVRAACGPYLKRFATARWRVARSGCFVLPETRRADGVNRTRSYLQYIFDRRCGSGGAGPRNGFVRKIMHAGALRMVKTLD